MAEREALTVQKAIAVFDSTNRLDWISDDGAILVIDSHQWQTSHPSEFPDEFESFGFFDVPNAIFRALIHGNLSYIEFECVISTVLQHRIDMEKQQQKILNELSADKEEAKDCGYVYLVRNSGRSFKIGKSIDPEKRLKQFQTSNPDELELVCCVYVRSMKSVEREVQRLFPEKRLNGEWFELAVEEQQIVVDFLESKSDEGN